MSHAHSAHLWQCCRSFLPLPLQAGQLRGSVNILLPPALLLALSLPLLLALLLLLLLSGFQCRTMISPLPLHTRQSAAAVAASNPEPCPHTDSQMQTEHQVLSWL